MKLLHRILLLVALFGTAIICYAAGSASGTVLFIVIGAMVELLFWMQLISSKKASS